MEESHKFESSTYTHHCLCPYRPNNNSSNKYPNCLNAVGGCPFYTAIPPAWTPWCISTKLTFSSKHSRSIHMVTLRYELLLINLWLFAGAHCDILAWSKPKCFQLSK